eukprot:Platyproteum_vivax@DN270_c0_g1_i1.p1
MTQEVLVIGGTDFLGRTIVERVLECGYKVTLLHRGKPHWGSTQPFGDRVVSFQANRNKPQRYAALLRRKKWRAVIDMCAYHVKDIKGLFSTALDYEMYIFISTDSVYEVCDVRASRSKERGRLRRGMTIMAKDSGDSKNTTCLCDGVHETEAVRFIDVDIQKKMNAKDSYGNEKLWCEEYLSFLAQMHNDKLYYSLRLADVLGPYDNTFRLAGYWWWLLAPSSIGIRPDTAKQRLSFTYSEDVASFICLLLGNHPPIERQETAKLKRLSTDIEPVLNRERDSKRFHSWNLACEETVNMEEFLNLFANVVKAAPPMQAAKVFDDLPQYSEDSVETDAGEPSARNQTSGKRCEGAVGETGDGETGDGETERQGDGRQGDRRQGDGRQGYK